MTDDFEVFSDTVGETWKVENLRRNPRIAFVIGETTAGDERTVQYEGLADEPTGAELKRLKMTASPPGARDRGHSRRGESIILWGQITLSLACDLSPTRARRQLHPAVQPQPASAELRKRLVEITELSVRLVERGPVVPEPAGRFERRQ